MRILSINMPFGKFRWASPLTRERLALSMAVLSVAAALLAAVPAEAQRDRTRPTISSARVIDPYLVEVTFSEQMEYAAHAYSAKIIVNGTEYPKNMATMMCHRARGAGTCNTHNTQWLWVQTQDPIYSGNTVTFSYFPTEEESGYRIRDRAGNQLLQVTSYPVTNNSTATKPTLTIESVNATVAAGGTARFRIRATANGAVWPSLTRTISSRPGSHGFPFRLVGLPIYVEYSTPFGSQVKHLMRQHRDGDNYWDLEKYVPTGRGNGPLTVTLKPYGKFYSVGSSNSTCIRIGSGPACASSQVSAEPLTAAFDEVPGSHDGTAFSFQIEFSEAVWASADQMRSAVGVTGGTVTTAALATGSNRLWDFTVTPSGTGNVTLSLTLPETCTETGAICTSDGRKLSTAVAIEVAYGHGLSVADAEAIEGDDATLDFTVTLSPPVSSTVTVEYATSDGTATAGSDYTATSGTLTFSSNETTKTVSVPILDDTVEDHGETFTLTLSNPSGAVLADATATGTIAAPPLTATFGDVPEYHDGENAFTFSLQFSENVSGLSHETLRDDVFYISGGSVIAARRKTSGNNQSWEIEVQPSARETVSITLLASAVESSDGRSLSAAVSATVLPQPLLTASFQDVPVSHDGENAFTFSLQFSENVAGLGYATLRDTLEIDGGSVIAARRKTSGNNQSWEIEVEPDGNGAVSITLPVGAVETSDGRSLNAAVSATVASPTTTPLTASFQDVPASHDGENTFTFNLQFSENVSGLSHETLRDDAFEIDGGSVIAARRKTSGNNQSWEIEVEPDGNGAVSITLPVGAVETSGGLRLNAAVSASVAEPPSSNTVVLEPDESRGSRDIGTITLISSQSGTIQASWEAPSQTPADYRISWAKADENFPTWSDLSGNAFPTTASHTITGLDGGEQYKVMVRARYNNGFSGDWSGQATITVIGSSSKPVVPSLIFGLGANYPNPFNPETHIAYTLSTAGPVELAIYNILGQRVRTLVQEIQVAGSYRVMWNGRNDNGVAVASGIYLSRLSSAQQVQVRRLLLLK